MNTNDTERQRRVDDMRQAAEETTRAVRTALAEWEREVAPTYERWTITDDDGLWTVLSSAIASQVTIHEPDSLPGHPYASMRDVPPSNVAGVLLALGAPDVTG